MRFKEYNFDQGDVRMLLNSSEIFGVPKHLVMDPVHGGIPYFGHEKKVIDHPLFQRLRHIKQNDILQFVFPGAVHSRFEHSLGTMHVAGRIFKSMIRNYLIGSNAPILSNEHIKDIQYCYGCLRLAALLHDAGHLPFSHQFQESAAGKKLLSDKDVINRICTEDSPALDVGEEKGLEHEHYSVLAACEILREVQELGFEPDDVIGMMKYGNASPSKQFCESAKRILMLFSKVPDKVAHHSEEDVGKVVRGLFKDIISEEIDADKMDYLLRDSYFSGCKYGTYNIDHLIQNICVGFDDRNLQSPPWIGIALKHKGLGALEDFVHSRFRMYLEVYGHKTVVGFKRLIHEAIEEILKDTECSEYIKRSLSDMKAFASFTDTYCWEAFRKYALKHKDSGSACEDLIARRRLEHIKQIDRRVDFEKLNTLEALEKEFGKSLVIQHECSSNFSRIRPSFDRMRLLIRQRRPRHEAQDDGDKWELKLEAITTHSTFFSKFDDVVVTHYYKRPKWFAEDRKQDEHRSET